MLKIFDILRAEFIKVKNTSFYWFHICTPIIGVAIYLVEFYFRNGGDAMSKCQSYFQTISVAFPLLIGIVCSMAIEQEADAGRFKDMLGCVYGKQVSLIGKILMILLSGFISTIIAIGGFSLGFKYILHQNELPLSFYGYIILIAFGSQIFLYLFHIWLSLLWGPGASIGIGIFESMISALMSTGLGQGTWQFIPSGWCMRFTTYFSEKIYTMHQSINELPDFIQGIRNSIIFTVIFGILLIIWFQFYEGRKEV